MGILRDKTYKFEIARGEPFKVMVQTPDVPDVWVEITDEYAAYEVETYIEIRVIHHRR